MSYGRNQSSRRRTVRKMYSRPGLGGNKKWLRNYCMAAGFRGLEKPQNIAQKLSEVDNDSIMGGSICPDGQMPMDGECMSVVQWII